MLPSTIYATPSDPRIAAILDELRRRLYVDVRPTSALPPRRPATPPAPPPSR